jgi:hypothetical protein
MILITDDLHFAIHLGVYVNERLNLGVKLPANRSSMKRTGLDWVVVAGYLGFLLAISRDHGKASTGTSACPEQLV